MTHDKTAAFNRYILCKVIVNGQTEILDTTIDGGEGEPLIVGSFHAHSDAAYFAACANAMERILRTAKCDVRGLDPMHHFGPNAEVSDSWPVTVNITMGDLRTLAALLRTLDVVRGDIRAAMKHAPDEMGAARAALNDKRSPGQVALDTAADRMIDEAVRHG